MAAVPTSTLVTASQSIVDQCGLYSVDVVPMNTNISSHNVAAALLSAVSGSSIHFTIHTRIVDQQKLQAAREQQQLQRAQTLQFQKEQERQKALAAVDGNSDSPSRRRRAAPIGASSNANGNVFDEVDDDGNDIPLDQRSGHSTPPAVPADEGPSSPAALSQTVTVINDQAFYDPDEIMITQNALVTYTVKRSLEHFVWFQRQLSEKEPFLLFGELPTSLSAAYADPLKTANQITAMLMFLVRSKATASDPFLWSLLTSADDDFQAQYLSLVGSADEDDDGLAGAAGVTPDLIAATDFIANTQDNISGMQSGSSVIAPLRWHFNIGNSWTAGSPFEGRSLEAGDEAAGGGSDVDEEEGKAVAHIRRLERLMHIVDQDEYSAEVIKRTREKIQRAGLAPVKAPTQLRFEREQRRKVAREKKTKQLLQHINEKLTLPDGDIKPEQISKGMVESGMIDRAFFSCDKLNMTTLSAQHFEKELVKHDKLFYAWGDALDAAYRLKVAMEDLALAEEAVAPALRDLCDTNYWPWTKEKVFEEELKPKLSPRVHTSHRLTHYSHRIANIHGEVARIEKNFVSDGLISAITLGAMLYSGHRWSCAMAHQRVHRGNKIDAALRHAVLGLDQYISKSRSAAPGVTVTNQYTVNEMKKTLLGVPPIFVQAVRTSLTPTAPTTGRSLLGLQKDLKTIFELGRGVSEADLLDLIDDDTSDIQDSLDEIIETFQGHFKEIRHDALYANVHQYLKELCVFLKFSWMSAELAIKDTHKNIDEDLFMDLGREDLTFVMQKKTDPKEKYIVPAGFKVKEYESANTMIQQFRQALEKSRATLSIGPSRFGGDISSATADEKGSMIRNHVHKQGGGGHTAAITNNSNGNSTANKSSGGFFGGKPFIAPTLHNPFDMTAPPIPAAQSSGGSHHRHSASPYGANDLMGEEMQDTSEDEWKQRQFLQQMAELQVRQKNQHLAIEASRLAGNDKPTTPVLISTLTATKLPPMESSMSSSVASPKSGSSSSPIAINGGKGNNAPVKASIFASIDDSMAVNSSSVGSASGVGSAGTKKRRFGRGAVDKDDPFA